MSRCLGIPLCEDVEITAPRLYGRGDSHDILLRIEYRFLSFTHTSRRHNVSCVNYVVNGPLPVQSQS